MAPLMTSNEQDLARINLFRMAMSPIGNMIVSAASLPIINPWAAIEAAWIKVTSSTRWSLSACFSWCFFGTQGTRQHQAAQEAEAAGKRSFWRLIHNKVLPYDPVRIPVPCGFTRPSTARLQPTTHSIFSATTSIIACSIWRKHPR